MAYNKLFDSNSKDNVREDSNLLQVKNEQDFEDQDSSLNMNDSLNNYYSESPTMFRLSRSFDGAYDDFSMEKQQKPKEDKRKRDIEKKTSEAFQPIIPKPKKLGGTHSIKKNKLENNDLAKTLVKKCHCNIFVVPINTQLILTRYTKLAPSVKKTTNDAFYLDTGSKGRGRRMTFKAKTSGNVRKPRTKLFKIPCKHCDPSNSSNKIGSPCIKHYFCNLSKKSNVTAVNDLLKSQEQGTDHEEIEADTNKVNEGIFQDINEGTVLSVGAKNKDQMKDRELTNNLRSEVQNSTVDDVRVSNQGENVEEIAKPIDQNSVESNGISKTRNKRKPIPIKRLLKEIPQKRRNNSKESRKDFLTAFPSNSKIQHKSDTECETTKTTPKITATKTMRLKKISAAGGDSQNYTNVSNPSPQITNLSKQSQQARQEMGNLYEAPIIANDKQGFLNVDLPLVELQNSTSEKSRNTLGMPLLSDLPITGTQNSTSRMSKHALCRQLFGSFSEESTQSVDSNMRDDNNNTELNSVQPYLPIEELPQIDQDKAGINEGTAFSASAKNKADQINAEALKNHQNQYKILQSVLPIENNAREPTNNLRSKVQDSTVDDVRVSNQGENVEEIAKPIDQNSVESNGISKTRNKRKSIPIKRSLKETPQKRRNNSKESRKDFLTAFPSNSKIQHKSDTECETTKTTPKITETKTMRLKKISAAGGDSQNYTNVSNPSPQITNLSKQSQQARQEIENLYEVPIIADDKQGFLNVADLPLVALQNSTSEKSRNTLGMPLVSDLPITGTQNSTSRMSKHALCRQLFGSFSEESTQSVDSNVRDDNNNTELNSVQPYLPIEELPKIDQDKAGINEGTAFSASAKNKADQINAEALKTHQNQYKILQSVLPIENNPREPTNNLRSKVQDSTVDDVRVSNQGENVEEIAKPIDQNSVESNGISKTRNKRKSIPIKRSLKETPQKRRNNSKESRKDFLTAFPSNSKIQHKSDTECETTKTTPKITETKTMRLKKISAAGGDSQNYTNVSNPSPQITNLSKQSQQARQEIENLYEVPIIADDKQGFLNVADLPLVALQNSTSEKSRNTLGMPLVSDLPITGTQNSTSRMSKHALCRQLFGSFSEESTQSVDSNVRDDNNNTELNSVQPYLPIEELPKIDQDKAGINEGTAFSASAKNKADQINAEALKTHQNQYKILQSVLPIENNPREPTNNLRSKVQDSTVDDVRVSNQGENVEEIAKPIDQNSVESNGISKTRYKRKSIPIKRSLKETPQKRRNNSKESRKDFLTAFPSNSKIQHKSDTECETTKTTPKITETKTMRLKKISAAGGDSQNYTNVSNPSPQITNLSKQSQQARQEIENLYEVPIIADDKQGFLNVADLPLVALQNSTSEKSRNTLGMPLVSDLPITGTQNSTSRMSKHALCRQLFGSFSEESTQSVDSNVRDDNNNTELNSVQPYLPIEELPKIDQDKAGINEGTAFSASAKNKADQINAEALKTHQNQYKILQSVLPIENNPREPTNNLRSKVQDSTVDDVRVSNQGENVEEIAKPIDQNSVESNGISKTRYKRKSIPIKRSLKETPQKRRNNSKESRKDFLTAFPSNSKIQHKSDTECETTKTTPKITETKTMRLKKISAAGGDSQNYTNVSNPSPQITNLSKQSQQARQEIENLYEAPIIANDKQGFLNVDLPLVELQNSTSEKSRNTLDMPLLSDLPITGTQNSTSRMSKQALCRQLFGSFSEESTQSVDSNMRDDNNNTELNSVQPYPPIEELPQIDQDKAGINAGTAFSASAKNKEDQISAEALKTHQNQCKILQSVLPIENNAREPTNNLRSKVQDSTVDDVRVSNQGENVEEIAKAIDQNSVESNGISKTRNKKKSIPIKRSLKETPQKRRNNSKESRKDFLTAFPSNSKIQHKSDTECETTKTTPKITETKTMRLKKISAAGGDSQNYTNVSNPSPQITNLSKQSQQARQEMENLYEAPIIANDKQGFLNVDLPLVELQNSTSKKSRNTLGMPLLSDLPITGTQNSTSRMSKHALCRQLFGSFSEESTQSVDSNMRDDNNNTELNSVQPYLPIEELPQIDQDKAGINEGTAFSASAKNKADQINAEALKTHQNQYKILQSVLPIENNPREPTNNLRSKVQDSTVDDVRVSNQGENVEEIAKPIDQNSVESNGISKTRNKRKSIPIKRSLKETPQKRRNNSKGSRKDFLTAFSSNSKIQHKSDTECEQSVLPIENNPREPTNNLRSEVQNSTVDDVRVSNQEYVQAIAKPIDRDYVEPKSKIRNKKKSVPPKRSFEETPQKRRNNSKRSRKDFLTGFPSNSEIPSKVSKRRSNESDKSNLQSGGVRKSTDGGDRLKLDKGEKLKVLSKNKGTQTKNTFKAPRRPRGRPLTKPVVNFVLTQTQKKDVYDVKMHAVNKKYVQMYDLGPNPRPKFKIVAGNQPHIFIPADGKYPNTTWTKCVDSGRVALDSCGSTDVKSEKTVITSNQLLESDQKFEHSEIEKGRVVEAIEKDLKELFKIEAFNVEVPNSDTLSSGEGRNVDTFVDLYDDIEPHLFKNDTSPCSFSSNSSGRFSISKVFGSIADIEIDLKKKSEDNTCLETPNVDNSISCSLSDILQSVTDGPSSDQVDGVNISGSLSNYRQDMNKSYDDLMGKMEKSFDDLSTSIIPITEGSSISCRLILQNLNGQIRQDEIKGAVNNIAKARNCTSINKNSGGKRKTTTLPEYYKQTKAKGPLMPENLNGQTSQHEGKVLTKRRLEGTQKGASNVIAMVKSYAFTDENSQDNRKTLSLPGNYKENEVKCVGNFTRDEKLAKIRQRKDNWIKTPKNSGDTVRNIELKPPASQKTASTAQDNLRSIHAPLSTRDHANSSDCKLISPPEKSGEFVFKSKVNMIPVATPSCPRTFVDSTKSIPKVLRERSTNISHAIFKKPKDLAGAPIHSNPNPLQNHYENPEDLLADLVEISKSINDKNDTDERAMVYYSWKQKLEEARTNAYPTLYQKLRKYCVIQLRRYIFPNMPTTQPPLPHSKVQISYEQDITPPF